MIIEVEKINEVFVKIICERSVSTEISEYFSFFMEGYRFAPAFKNKLWDGKIRLAKILPNGDVQFYLGLMSQLKIFCEDRDYTLVKNYTDDTNNITEKELTEFIDSLNLQSKGQTITVRDYQFTGVLNFLNNKRLVLLSPTACLDPNTMIEIKLGHRYQKVSMYELRDMINIGLFPKINTPTGLEKITDVYTKSGPGVEILFEDSEIPLRVANNHLIWFHHDWREAINFQIGDVIKSRKIKEIKSVEIQEWIDFSIDASHESYYHDGLLHHNSGKSLILYIIIRYLMEYKCQKALFLVPNTSLLYQIFSDFQDYSSANGWNAEEYIHLISAGVSKTSEKPIIISTWQSLQSNIFKNKNKKSNTDLMSQKFAIEYFKQFDFVAADECHLCRGVELTGILEKCINANYRIGVTGTLSNTKIHALQLESLFGKILNVTTNKKLMDKGEIANLEVKCLILKYPSEITKLTKKLNYREEIGFLISNKERNNFIKNLALSLKGGNTLLLYQYVETHGKILYDLIRNSKFAENKIVYFIHGNIKPEEREEIRSAMELHNNVILIGSVGTVSTGTNIKNLHNIIFASPCKSRIRTLQSIGRILRLHESKTKAVLYDIADDLRAGKHKNYTILHFLERCKIYDQEKFNYKIIKVDMKNTEI